MAEREAKRNSMDEEWELRKHEVCIEILNQCVRFLKTDNKIVENMEVITEAMGGLARTNPRMFMNYITKPPEASLELGGEESKAPEGGGFWKFLENFLMKDKEIISKLLAKLLGL